MDVFDRVPLVSMPSIPTTDKGPSSKLANTEWILGKIIPGPNSGIVTEDWGVQCLRCYTFRVYLKDL